MTLNVVSGISIIGNRLNQPKKQVITADVVMLFTFVIQVQLLFHPFSIPRFFPKKSPGKNFGAWLYIGADKTSSYSS
jgi:hypothetical protein